MERRYFSNDFNFEEYRNEIECSDFNLFCCSDAIETNKAENVNESQYWNIFYQKHKSGKFYKSRNYLLQEFKNYFSPLISSIETSVIVECGAGHGATIYSLIDKLPSNITFLATDYSEDALASLKDNSAFDCDRIQTSQWDITRPLDITLPYSPRIVICMFTMSAIHPMFHYDCLKNMTNILKSGSVILFRDYGIFDFTMFKQKSKVCHNLYRRGDKTLSFYFTVEYFESLIEKLTDDLEIVEISYCTILSTNRKTKDIMKRIYLHSVIKKK